jgi:uncharacterized repeat protein (TIGR01451 family)/uncharacterized delta-60 repeat protein
MVLIKYKADGSLDTSFGSGGFATTVWHNLSLGAALGSILVLPDGTILEGGGTTLSGNQDKFSVVRWAANGKTEDGFACYDVPGSFSETISGMAQQASGDVVAVGTAQTSGPDGNEFAFVRFDPTKLGDAGCGTSSAADASLDTGFGASGFTTVNFAPSGIGEEGAAQIVAPPGAVDILATGSAVNSVGAKQVALVKLKASDGTPDAVLGDGGKILLQVPPDAGALGMGLSPSVVPGFVGAYVGGLEGFGGPFVARVDTAGRLDKTFGPNGEVVIPFGNVLVQQFGGIATDADNQPIVTYSVSAIPHNEFGAMRLLSDGAPDPGWASAPVALDADGAPAAVVVRPSGAVLLVGLDGNAASSKVGVVQLTGGRSSDLATTLTLPATATVGDSITATATLTNAGPDRDGGTQLAFTLPAGLTVTSIDAPSGNSCTTSGQVACAPGQSGLLFPTQGETYTLHLRATGAGSQQLTGTVSGNNFELQSGNDRATATVLVGAKTGPPVISAKVLPIKIRRLLRTDTLGVELTSTQPASIDIQITVRVKRHGHRVTARIASGHVQLSSAGHKTLGLDLTAAGATALRSLRSVTLKLAASATNSDGLSASAASSLKLKR